MSELFGSSDELLSTFLHPWIGRQKWSDLPFNGQLRRARAVKELLGYFAPTVNIETGTYRGITTEFLFKLTEVPTHTIEANPELFIQSSHRFRALGSDCAIIAHLGDSAERLREILRGLDPHQDRVFAYLDAHWEESLPLASELNHLVAWGGPFVAVIDDFFTGEGSAYGYDFYGDLVVGKTQIPRGFGLRLFVPDEPTYKESGAMRGTGYLFSAEALSRIDQDFIQRYSLKEI